MDVKIKLLTKNAQKPTKANVYAAGYDIYADHDVIILPHEQKLIPTGFAMEIPTGYYAAIVPRSGLSWKKMCSINNSPGIIDSDYRGEVKIMLINHSDDRLVIEQYQRIAQMIIHKLSDVEMVVTYDLTSTDRGDGGFGSTGK